MGQKDILLSDQSGDRKYFTIIPNFVLNHSSLWDREVYIQMKRIAGENGTCWMSQETLSKQCGMSVNRLKKSLKYLINSEWIKLSGKRPVKTTKGIQKVNEYVIVDLWKRNIEFYKEGVAPNDTPKQEGVSRDTLEGYHESAEGVSPDAYKEEPLRRTIKEDSILKLKEAKTHLVEKLGFKL